ncbi:VENN motif pre-toxin domain-containing protein [Escherichia coli]|uniref:VENN motif pre-toxin domain-containing protein n=1 Tax=Escherichia coli TaxID=562 RepID=UPI0038B3F09A
MRTEKLVVSTLAAIAAGLVGGSGASAVAGAQLGKTTVENNLLGGSELLQTEKAREHGADVLSCSDNPSGEACKRGPGLDMGLAIMWSSLLQIQSVNG